MTRRRQRTLPVAALLAAFCGGMLVDGWLRTYGPPMPAQARPSTRETDSSLRAGPDEALTDTTPDNPMSDLAKASEAHRKMPAIGRDPGAVATTGTGSLRLPIDDFDIERMKGGFEERRGSRQHEAVDMLAARNTPVHAVDNGTIAKLFVSKQGGITIYQYDPSNRLCYYYAHLERYADGLREGQAVSRGDVIGYVGTTGNAPAGTPHLHFAVMELDPDRKWWHGRAIDPYLVFKQRGTG